MPTSQTPASPAPPSRRRWLLIAAHLWGPLLLFLPGSSRTVAGLLAALLVGVLLSGSLSVPLTIRRRHGWIRALLVSSLVGAAVTLPIGLLAADWTLLSSPARQEAASWVFFGLVLSPLMLLATVVPFRAARSLPLIVATIYRRMQRVLRRDHEGRRPGDATGRPSVGKRPVRRR